MKTNKTHDRRGERLYTLLYPCLLIAAEPFAGLLLLFVSAVISSLTLYYTAEAFSAEPSALNYAAAALSMYFSAGYCSHLAEVRAERKRETHKLPEAPEADKTDTVHDHLRDIA